MPLNPDDQLIVDYMKQRELHMKRQGRATDAMLYRERRFRVVLLTVAGTMAATLVAVIIFEVMRRTLDRVGWWLPGVVIVVLFAIMGVQFGRALLRSPFGQRLLAINQRKLGARYAGDLNAGRRWTEFYHNGEDIAPYVPQILYFLEADPRFDTVDDALAFAKQNRRDNPVLAAQAVKLFDEVARATNLMVLATSNAAGTPSGRLMRFVRSSTRGVWYVTTAPEGPKVPELDRGAGALVTVQPEDEGVISSNRLVIRRAPLSLVDIADLYLAQAPHYLDGLSEEAQRRELVYEVRLYSAKVDTLLEHERVEFLGG